MYNPSTSSLFFLHTLEHAKVISSYFALPMGQALFYGLTYINSLYFYNHLI